MQADFGLTFKLTEQDEGDLADLEWLEEITGFMHLGSGSMSLSGSGTHYLDLMMFVHNPDMLIMRFDKDVTIQFDGHDYGNGQTSGPIPVEIMDGRYGYAVITAPQQAQHMIVTTTETTETMFASFGNPES